MRQQSVDREPKKTRQKNEDEKGQMKMLTAHGEQTGRPQPKRKTAPPNAETQKNRLPKKNIFADAGSAARPEISAGPAHIKP